MENTLPTMKKKKKKQPILFKLAFNEFFSWNSRTMLHLLLNKHELHLLIGM